MNTETKNRVFPLRRLSNLRPNGSVLLFGAAILAILLANSAWHESYQQFLNQKVVLSIGKYSFFEHNGQNMTLLQFVNDALMAVFFFLVGLEIKQEILVGELSSPKKALLPVIAAVGGMIVPVCVFYIIAHDHPASLGAAIPMATDIAFALAVLSTLGKKVPYSLKIFLTALAVVDDIGGIIVIAIFYSSHFSFIPLLISLLILAIITLAGRAGANNHVFYYVMGFIVWTLFLESGVHATIAGVLLAMCIPAKPKVNFLKLPVVLRELTESLPREEQKTKAEAVLLSEHQQQIINTIRLRSARAISPLQSIEAELSPFVNFFVLPLFAFVNSGVTFGGITAEQLLHVPLAIFLGLLVGKTVGIFGFTWLSIKTSFCKAPTGMTIKNLFGVSIFGGIGFTVSLFIANLSYGAKGYMDLLNEAKMGIFAGTIVSGFLGYIILNLILRKEHKREMEAQAKIEETEATK
ncbi:Na+/H+ antiporter NhaA [Porphyromonas macacae]|uniref:Na+/H+ antiporter NhaA n=1 Tax=Porphyromonas macacae TaxID=28115 RepID=UPI00359F84C2